MLPSSDVALSFHLMTDTQAARPAGSLRVRLIARTEFLPPEDVSWETDATGGEALAEFAGRACYQSWSKPLPATATNRGYLDHILQVGHLSVLEHSTATFYLTGIARSVTHELIRHRHFSYSQLSQRYLPPGGPEVVEPDVIAADSALHEIFVTATAQSATAYQALLSGLEANTTAADGTLARKQARQAARSVLPNSVDTAVVITGNYRAFRHFIGMRATEAADVGIRTLAVALLVELQVLAPNVFADFRISALADGTAVAASPLVGDG